MYKNTNKTISIKNYEHHLKNLLPYVEKDKTDHQLTEKSKLKTYMFNENFLYLPQF